MPGEESTSSASGWNLGRWATGALLLLWALFITYLFLAPPTWAILPFAPFRPAGHGKHMFAIWTSLFGNASWNWMVGWETWRDLAIGAVGLMVMTGVGRLFLSCFRVYLPRGVSLALSFVMGVGVCGVLYTFIAMGGFLYQWLALVALAGLVVTLAATARKIIDDPRKERVRKEIARSWESDTWLRPWGKTALFENILLKTIWTLFALLTILTFYHAVFFPVTYWDSLILYLGHARAIFLEHAFPEKVVLQVGVGLGSNYPHLYELTGATIATWANHWSPIYLQLAAPLAGLLSMILIYHTVLRLSRSVLVAAIATLLLRAVPHLLSYHIYASNYTFAILYAAAFFYLALRYIEDGLPVYLALATLSAAFAVHINYLMGSLWLCWGATIVMAHWPRRPARQEAGPEELGSQNQELRHNFPPEFYRATSWPTLGSFLASCGFWTIASTGLAVGAIWYARNWIVTGNPVYAFFTNVFTGTKNFNPDVLASASAEWQSHGAGIGIYGPSLLNRIASSWSFFVNDYKGAHHNYCWRWAPSIVGVALPGALILLATSVREFFSIRKNRSVGVSDETRFGLVAFFFAAILFSYHYCMGPFYLYHLLGCFAVFGVFIYFALSRCSRPILWGFAIWAIFCALVPGLPMAMMGQKLTTTSIEVPPLTALRNPGIEADLFYSRQWGNLPPLWNRLNKECKDTGVLTHENRHLLFDPSIRLVHMDDWEVQQVWGASSQVRLELLESLGVRFYLRVPFEDDHPVNARLGHREWVENGTLEEISRAVDKDGNPHVLYRFLFDADDEANAR